MRLLESHPDVLRVVVARGSRGPRPRDGEVLPSGPRWAQAGLIPRAGVKPRVWVLMGCRRRRVPGVGCVPGKKDGALDCIYLCKSLGSSPPCASGETSPGLIQSRTRVEFSACPRICMGRERRFDRREKYGPGTQKFGVRERKSKGFVLQRDLCTPQACAFSLFLHEFLGRFMQLQALLTPSKTRMCWEPALLIPAPPPRFLLRVPAVELCRALGAKPPAACAPGSVVK